MTIDPVEGILHEITEFFASQPQVVAVALSGSRTRHWSDDQSDLDLYVYVSGPLPAQVRREFILPRASHAEIQNTFWEEGDEWDERQSGLHLDVMYRWTDFVEREIQALLVEHQGRIGYTTAVLGNVAHSRVLFDRDGWLSARVAELGQPYPDELARQIVSRNWPLLRDAMGSYLKQITLAVQRQDFIAINHRLAAYLASYTDILFAVNRQYHPGEKRLLQRLEELPLLPAGCREQLTRILQEPHSPDLPERLQALTDSLAELLKTSRLLPDQTQ